MTFEKMRGQAFDTMMLVISVIVAVAILGILLSILPTPKPFDKPLDVIRTELTSINSAGFGVSLPKSVVFDKGTLILRESVVAGLPIRAEEVAFACDSSGTCGSDVLDVTDSHIDAKVNSKAYAVVCGKDSSTNNPKYCVGLGRQAEDARTACVNKCRITV
ncbi:hypothetical protein HY994_04940 [Candidatus Micrarchaeota archaeon]|nr:hypothetical protein [Candidatus Micrarchaeota archaeon]